MVKFKGRSMLRQTMKGKLIKSGFKIWSQCCSRSYTYNFKIYHGARIGETPKDSNFTMVEGVVLDLCELLAINVQYPTKKSERRFFCFEPPIHISGNCLVLRMKKGVIASISPWLCLHPFPQKNMNKIRQAVWVLSWREKMNNELFPLYTQDFGSF
jgi:hypothetical protein